MPSTDSGMFKYNSIFVPFSASLNATVRPVKFKNSHFTVYMVVFQVYNKEQVKSLDKNSLTKGGLKQFSALSKT